MWQKCKVRFKKCSSVHSNDEIKSYETSLTLFYFGADMVSEAKLFKAAPQAKSSAAVDSLQRTRDEKVKSFSLTRTDMWPKRVFESSESASQPPRSVRKSEGAGKPRPLPVTADSYQWNHDSFSFSFCARLRRCCSLKTAPAVLFPEAPDQRSCDGNTQSSETLQTGEQGPENTSGVI